jgi:hypothetical protein
MIASTVVLGSSRSAELCTSAGAVGLITERGVDMRGTGMCRCRSTSWHARHGAEDGFGTRLVGAALRGNRLISFGEAAAETSAVAPRVQVGSVADSQTFPRDTAPGYPSE